MSTAFEQLLQHLHDRGVAYDLVSEREGIRADFTYEVGDLRIYAMVEAQRGLFVVIGVAPVRVPEGARAVVNEAVTRANYGLNVGGFQMDLDDGELRYQAGHVMNDGELPDRVIEQLIGTTLAMLNRYVPAVLSVIYANEVPKDAVRLAETA